MPKRMGMLNEQRLIRWVLALCLSFSLSAEQPAGRSNAGWADRKTAHSGAAPFDFLPRSDTNFVVDTGPGLDTGCTYRSEGSLIFDIEITRYVGETNADGTLKDPQKLIANGVISPTAKLRMPVYDVDFDATPPAPYQPERDLVTVNGKNVGGGGAAAYLTGANEVWKLNEFEFPIEILKFPQLNTDRLNGHASPPTPAHNRIQVDVDVANAKNDGDAWCTAVDWASLSFGAMAPLMLIHGTNAQSDTWELQIVEGKSPVDWLRERGIVFQHHINLQANGSADENATLLSRALDEEAAAFGVQNIHLVTHSKGATDSRRYLNVNYVEGHPFKVLSLYSIGTPSAGTILSDYAVNADKTHLLTLDGSTDPLIRTTLKDCYKANWLSLVGGAPSDPARTVQMIGNMTTFNDQNPKYPGIPYYAAAGNADANDNKTIEAKEALGMFPSVMPSFLQVKYGNRVYEALGRTKTLKVSSGSILFGQIGYTYGEGVLSPDPEPNDMVSTAASTLYKDFTPLTSAVAPAGIYPWNHSALKNGIVMERILNQIRTDYPLQY